MKQTRSNSEVFYLLEETIRNILKLLPVKSLLRFQCVCKDWKNLIHNQSFIQEHLNHFTHQNHSLLLECSPRYFPLRWLFLLLDCSLQASNAQIGPSMDSLVGAKIVSSCNGLLLVEQNKKYPPLLSLWNYATISLKHVPLTITDCPKFDRWVTGFGFCPILNDYKIVITYGEHVNRGEVFSLSRGLWKGIDVGNLNRVRLLYDNVTVNGAIFWTGVKETVGEGDVGAIISFDLSKEVFTFIPRPFIRDKREKLTVYQNKLAMLHNIWDHGSLIDLWVLDEGTCTCGETWRLVKRYTHRPFSCLVHSMTIWRNDIVSRRCLQQNQSERHVFYLMNITTDDEVKTVHGCYDYVESLVLVGNNYILH